MLLFILAVVLVIHTPVTAGAQSGGHPAQPATFQTLRDTFPNFAQRPTIVSARSGSWSAAATWTPNRAPRAGDVVLIQGPHSVTYDQVSPAPLAVVGIAGALRFRTDIDTSLKVGTLFVQPGGSLVVGTREAPVRANVTAEIVIANRGLHTISPDPDTGVVDPHQYGTGLIVLGTVAIHGGAKDPTWIRLVDPPQAGSRVLRLNAPVGRWQPGDTLLIPDTRQLPIEDPRSLRMVSHYETEVVRISSVSSNGRQVTLAQPLQYNHRGAVNPDGTQAVAPSGEPLVPHVANLTRNVRIRSENPNGTRGHVMFTHQARVDVHNAQWIDLGRTTVDDLDSTKVNANGHVLRIGRNQIARYWVHFHFLVGPPRPTMPRSLAPAQMRTWLDRNGWQYEFSGNAITTSTTASHPFKWGIDVHASHYGKVTNNVVYNLAGSGLQTEDGSESYNLLAGNFVATVRGIGRILPPVPTHDPDVTHNHGRDGSGFWYRGPHNWMERNVAADVTYAGHYLSRYYLVASRDIPRVAGAVANGDRTHMRVMPVLSFAGNEAYGPMESGLYGAWVSGFGDAQNWPEIRIDRFVAWHPYYKQIEWYHNGKTTFNELVLRGDPDVTGGLSLGGADIRTVGMRLTHYENVDLTIDRADIRGLPKGIDLPTNTKNSTTRVRNSFFENYVNLSLLTKIGAMRVEISNVRFGAFGAGSRKLSGFYNEYQLRNYPSPLHISLERDPRKTDPRPSYDVRVLRYNGLIGDDFRLFDRADPASCRTTLSWIDGFACR
jgi:hypothetical protein